MIYKTCVMTEITNLCCIHVKKMQQGRKVQPGSGLREGCFLFTLAEWSILLQLCFQKLLFKAAV